AVCCEVLAGQRACSPDFGAATPEVCRLESSAARGIAGAHKSRRPGRTSRSSRYSMSRHRGPRKIMAHYLAIGETETRHFVRALLAKAQPVAKPASPKDEVRAVSRYLETRALDHIPSQDSTHYHLEIPSANYDSPGPIELNKLCSPRVVSLDDLKSS